MASFLPFALTLCSFCLAIAASKGGFTVELIHRDSPKSPYYNPSLTPFQRIGASLNRSIARAHQFFSAGSITQDDAQTTVTTIGIEYLMEFFLGTPPFKILAIADTGSDLVWTQCKPCPNCYKQDAPLFDPKSSSTYRDLSCGTKQCDLLVNDHVSNCSASNDCQYSYPYADGSHTIGNVAVDTVTLSSASGRPVSFPNTIIGCGLDNNGTFAAQGSGVIGLGGGPVSLISQMGSSIDGIFSYCLVPVFFQNSSSKINFGSAGVVSGPGVVSTPLVQKSPPTSYFLTLEAISVGSQKIPFRGSIFGEDGNIIIDSGTTLTILPVNFFKELANAIDEEIVGGERVDPQGGLALCYNVSSNFKPPNITAHFRGGAEVHLDPLNTFVSVSDNVSCSTFYPSNGYAVFGNLSQLNFLVGYDLKAKTVSFKPTDCTKH